MSEPVLQSTRPSAQATAAQASRAGAGRRRVPDPGAAATRMPRLEAVRMELPVLLATRPDLPGAQDPDYLLRALARQLNLPGEGAGITWSVRVCAQPDALTEPTFVLLLVDPTLAAVRDAYVLIKRLADRGFPHVGVLFRAGGDLAAARRCHHRLGVGALRFLDLSLVNLGVLPEPGPHFAAALAHAAHVVHNQRRLMALTEARA